MANLVQAGVQAMSTNASVTVSLGMNVDTSKSFIVIKTREIGVSNSNPDAWQIEAYFDTTGSSVNHFTLARYATGTGISVYWQVVTMDNIKVQHFSQIAFAGTVDQTKSQTLTTLAATNKAFAYCTSRVNTSTPGASDQGFFRASITSTTNCDVIRQSFTSTAEVTLQVIEFTDSTTVEHQTVTMSSTASTDTTLSNSIDPTVAWVIGTWTPNAAAINTNPTMYLTGATTLHTGRGAAGTNTTIIEAYVVNMAGVSTEVHSGTDLGTTTFNQTVSNLTDTTKAFVLLFHSQSGTGSGYANWVMAGASITSSTNVEVDVSSTANVKPYSLQTIQLPNTVITKRLATLGVG